MNSDLCWAYGDTKDCAWIHFGYGSRWDMLCGIYPKGFWLSLKGLKVFLYYDYPLDYRSDEIEGHRYLHINHPEADSWYKEAEKVAGKFLEEYPDYKENYRNVITPDDKPYYCSIPSLEEGIPSINPQDATAINRVYEINNKLVDNNDSVMTWLGPMKKEHWEAMQVTDEDMENLFNQLDNDRGESSE